MSTLYNAVLSVYRELGTLREGLVCSVGDPATRKFQDDLRPEPENYFKPYETAVLITKTTDGLAPQGEFGRLSAYDPDAENDDQITLDTALTAVITPGDLYAISTPKYSLQLVINAVNVILGTLDVPHEDISLSTIEGQTEYTIPSTIPKWGLRRVEIENDKTDANAQFFSEIHNCNIFHANSESTNTIVLPRLYSAGYTIKLVYVDSHDYLFNSSDVINEYIPVKKLAAVVAPEVVRMHMEQYPSGDKTVGGRLSMMVTRAGRINLKSYITLPSKSGKLIIHRIGR